MPPLAPNSNTQGTAGVYGTSDAKVGGNGAYSLVDLVRQMRKNFLDTDVEIMPGLLFNQYKLLQTIHYYLNSKFENGDVDENGNDKYFHNIINHRNAHTTKNIDLDTKDIQVETDLENKQWATWILRMELQAWMYDEHFARNLNQLAEDLPRFGSVVWKKVEESEEEGEGSESKVCIKNVDLRDLINDQTVEKLCHSQLVAERIVMTAKQISDKVQDGGWDADAVKALLSPRNTSAKQDRYLKESSNVSPATYSLTDQLPASDVYEVWGWVPETYLPKKFFPDLPESPDATKYVYIMAIIAGLETGTNDHVLFCQEASEEDFPYKDVHIRKTPGRWLGVGNTELLIPLQVRMNELVTRFFMALRLGSVHLFQTRGKLTRKNLLQDAQDGDIIESSHSIDPLATEIRAFNQYQNEVAMIDTLADKICNTPEVVTGESMPAATPFRLGAQLGSSAAKIFEFIRENCGLFVGDVMDEWVLPSIADVLTGEHVLKLMGSTDELVTFMNAYRRSIMLEQVKQYILKSHYLPTKEEFLTAEKALSEQINSMDKKLKVMDGFFKNTDLEDLRIFFDPTGERADKSAQMETQTNLLQILASNPTILQDPNTRMILGRILEASGISPLKLAGFVSEPQSPPPMVPQAGGETGGEPAPASPAAQKFMANSGSASPFAAASAPKAA